MRKLARRSPGPQLVRRSGSAAPKKQRGEADIVNRRPEAIAQRQLAEFIHASPRAVAQAKREAALRQETAQRLDAAPSRHLPHAEDQAGMEDDESLQLKQTSDPLQRLESDDESLQRREAAFPVQREAAEDEEPLQAMATEEELPAQRVEADDEALQMRAAAFPVQRVGQEDEEPLQAMGTEEEAPAQLRKDQPPARNQTGLPDHLKAGIESLSGLSMDHVQVHYNSSQPAQLNALAYAQGSAIHVAPGQEQHLPHEAWHVVQQAQGRVKPTTQMKNGVPVNDDAGLEHEADVMGAKALATVAQPTPRRGAPSRDSALQRLVAYAEVDNDTHNDYAVMKMLHQVSQHRDGHPVVPLNNQTDFSRMQAGETLFLAGHGDRNTGKMRMSATTSDLIGWLNHSKRGVPNNIGAITILSCYSGEVIGNTTLADQIAGGLQHTGISVSGGKGFSFGTPSLHETGESSVLALSNENLYWLGAPDTMGWQWADMKPTSTGGALKEKYSGMDVDTAKTIAENVAAELALPIVAAGEISSLTAKNNRANVIGVLDGMMRTFRKEATRIQNRLEFIIQRLPGNSVEAKLEVLHYPGKAGKDQKYAHAWPKLIADQYALFNKYYVFRPGGTGFHTVQS